ncbi:Hypp8800 [Branchiostoma lanceolatum]|uniref:Hypp8800 protein n=1 Tax=Branchiostoma lanceolatum TaxID=7740 RepID=A0A8K0EFZ3_BRALA|nr:Hypp8800 [Branchiostoma lanceolatum]
MHLLNQNKRLMVQVGHNQLRCDENLTWFICHLFQVRQISHRYHLECASPAERRGTILSTLWRDCQTNMTSTSHKRISITTDEDAPITSSYNRTIPTVDSTKLLSTDDVSVLQLTTEMGRVGNLEDPGIKKEDNGNHTKLPTTNDIPVALLTTEKARLDSLGDPSTNEDDKSYHAMVMICAVAVPLLLVLASVGAIVIYKRCYGASLAHRNQPGMSARDATTEESQNIEPYAVVYFDPAEHQADDSCRIPLYGADCPDTPRVVRRLTSPIPQQNIINQQAAIANQPVAQPNLEGQPRPIDADLETIYEEEEEGDDNTSSTTSVKQLVAQPEEQALPTDIYEEPKFEEEEHNNPSTIVKQPTAHTKDQAPPTDLNEEPKYEDEEEKNGDLSTNIKQPAAHAKDQATPTNLNEEPKHEDEEVKDGNLSTNINQPADHDQSLPTKDNEGPKHEDGEENGSTSLGEVPCEVKEETVIRSLSVLQYDGAKKQSMSHVLHNPDHGKPESKDSISHVLHSPAHGQPESKDSISHVMHNPAHGQPESKDSTSQVLQNPAHGQSESKDSISHVLQNPAHGQPESKDSTSHILHNLAHGQSVGKDSTSHVLHNPAHGQLESKDSTSHVLHNPAHGQSERKDSTSHMTYTTAVVQPDGQTNKPSVLYEEHKQLNSMSSLGR